jgi:Zn-dependent peptidase ImmA (M78 family)
MTVPVFPNVLRWTRESRVLTLEQAASRLEWLPERLLALESADEIAVDDLERLASRYKVSTATLLMPEPLPSDRYPPRSIDDFRLHERAQREPLSLKTNIYVENAFDLIELLAEVSDADGEISPKPLLPSFELTSNAERAAASERARIGIDADVQLGWETDREAFLRWRELLESQHLLIHKLAMEEKHVRGFAIFEKGFGLIAVNSKDEARPRIFTLFHEYGHLLLRRGGISDQNRKVPIERWCNQFAACFLMPREVFLEEYRRLFPRGGANDYQVGRLASRFKVSKASVAIRFEELGLAATGFYDQLSAGWQLPTPRQGGPTNVDQINTELGRFGTAHINAVLGALERGAIDRLEAQYALDVPSDHFKALGAAARERHRAYCPAL